MPPKSNDAGTAITNGCETTTGGNSIVHPNGRDIIKGLKRPESERMADYNRLIADISDHVDENDDDGNYTYLSQILKSLLVQYLIKQEHRIGWAHKSACDDTVLQSHPNETVASHQWGVAMLVKVLSLTPQFQEELPNFDCLRAIEMALLHDVPEAKVGDITPRDGISPDVKHQLEREAINEMLSSLPEPVKSSLHNIYSSYEDRECIESKLVKDCDKLDFMLTAFLLERQGFTGVKQFYDGSRKEGFSTKIAKDLADTIVKKRNYLVEKNLLFYVR